jgi:hypothetical protein
MWYARTAGFVMRGINFQMEARSWKAPLYGFRHFLFYFPCSIFIPRELGEQQLPPTQLHTAGMHLYDGVQPGALKGSLAILLSPPQSHAALGTMPYTLASVDQSPVCRPKTLLPGDKDAKGWILK